jgi:hypothetical protein
MNGCATQSLILRGIQTEGFLKHGAEENIWTEER